MRRSGDTHLELFLRGPHCYSIVLTAVVRIEMQPHPWPHPTHNLVAPVVRHCVVLSPSPPPARARQTPVSPAMDLDSLLSESRDACRLVLSNYEDRKLDHDVASVLKELDAEETATPETCKGRTPCQQQVRFCRDRAACAFPVYSACGL